MLPDITCKETITILGFLYGVIIIFQLWLGNTAFISICHHEFEY